MAPALAKRLKGKLAWGQAFVLLVINFNEAVQVHCLLELRFSSDLGRRWGDDPSPTTGNTGLCCSALLQGNIIWSFIPFAVQDWGAKPEGAYMRCPVLRLISNGRRC